MKFDIDTYREILDTLTRNKSRSFLTGFGVFWGVFMLVALIGGGKGLEGETEQQLRRLCHEYRYDMESANHQSL